MNKTDTFLSINALEQTERYLTQLEKHFTDAMAAQQACALANVRTVLEFLRRDYRAPDEIWQLKEKLLRRNDEGNR